MLLYIYLSGLQHNTLHTNPIYGWLGSPDDRLLPLSVHLVPVHLCPHPELLPDNRGSGGLPAHQSTTSRHELMRTDKDFNKAHPTKHYQMSALTGRCGRMPRGPAADHCWWPRRCPPSRAWGGSWWAAPTSPWSSSPGDGWSVQALPALLSLKTISSIW